jgi:hypothetical protein
MCIPEFLRVLWHFINLRSYKVLNRNKEVIHEMGTIWKKHFRGSSEKIRDLLSKVKLGSSHIPRIRIMGANHSSMKVTCAVLLQTINKEMIVTAGGFIIVCSETSAFHD